MIIWKKFKDDYLVSSSGKIYSLKTKKILKPIGKTYKMVYVNSKPYLLHRLVATVFIPNPNDLPIINHKDEDPSNNNADNLEWCTVEYNNNYGTRGKRIGEKLKGKKQSEMHRINAANSHKKKVYQYTKDQNLVNIWECVDDCAKKGFCSRNIARCCRGERKTHKGYIWSYKPL